MAATSAVSTNTVRANKMRGSGRRLIIWLCILFILVLVLMWSEELAKPLHGADHISHVSTKSDFAWNPRYPSHRDDGKARDDNDDDDDEKEVTNRKDTMIDDDYNSFSPPTNKVSGKKVFPFRIMPRFKEWKINQDYDGNILNSKNQNRKIRKSSLREKSSSAEKFQTFPIIQNTDDNIPISAGGSIIHAADALLCRNTVLDYVINATDLKDECDGLKKAYTQTCATDDEDKSQPEVLSRESQRERRLATQTNAVVYWQQKMSRWSHSFRSWWPESPTTTRRLLTEEKYSDTGEEFVSEEEQGREVLLKNQGDKKRKVEDGNKLSGLSFDKTTSENDESENEYSKNKISSSSQKTLMLDFPSGNSYGAVHRQTGEVPHSQENDAYSPGTNPMSSIDKEQEKEFRNSTKINGSTHKKTLVNLALPLTSKHVSEKMLTETLMLQQDNQLMKAVVNHTNHTITEAQADAAVSSKAVADAADMVSNVLNDPTSVEARTCCTSILNVFHENCNVNEEEELSDRRLFVGVAIIALCGLVKSLIRNFHIRWLPEAAGCIMVGVTVGYILTFYPHHDISFDGNWFLRIMVPPIVFEAALSIDKRSFSRHIVPILFYAVLGTLIATGATAFVVHEGSKLLHCETIPYAEALTFGALISSIDPIAVLSVLSNMGMTDQDTIYVVIFGESLLNDGVAIVLFETLVHFLDDDMIVDSHAVSAAAIHFLVVFIGSLLIGLGYGLCCTLYYWIMLGCQTPLVEVLMFCCWALLPYYVCDGIEWSGIVAVVAAGFIMDMYVVGAEKLVDTPNDETDSDYGDDSEKNKEHRRRSMARRPIFSNGGLLSKEAKTHIAFVTEIIATMMETAIFAYLGLFLFSSRYHWNYNHVFIAVSGCCISRAIMIPSLSSIANWITKFQQSRAFCTLHEIHPQFNNLDTASNHRSNQAAGVIIDGKMQLVLWFAGLRGAMSFALVEHIPQYDGVTGEGTRLKSELKAMTSACIIFTVFFLGGGTFYMMEALGLSPKSKNDYTVERNTEMIELLSSVTSTDAEEGTDDLDERQRKSHDDRNGTTSAEIYTNKPTTNTLRRPGRPVRRQRKTLSK